MSSPIVDIKTLGMNGSSLIVEITAKPIKYMNKLAVEVFMNDITIRKKAEERVNLLASIVESSDDAIIAKDMEGKIQYWNKGAENLYGFKSNEVLGKSIEVLHTRSSKNDFPGIMEILKKGGQINHYNTYRIRKDGGMIKVSIKISPIIERNEIIGASEIAYKLDST
jgi:PAS domain S-box-containing protein